MDRWVGRVAIVTGASAGIGAVIARLLAENGMKVIGVARRVDRVEELAVKMGQVKGELHAVQGDVTKEKDVVRVVKWTRDNLGGADVLVNNAGVLYLCPLTGDMNITCAVLTVKEQQVLVHKFLRKYKIQHSRFDSGRTHLIQYIYDADTANLKEMFDLNVLGMSMFTREVIKDMKSRGVDDGHVININAIMGHQILNFPGGYVYSATKHAIRVLTEGLRRELRDLNSKIRVSEISPGLVGTERALKATSPMPDVSLLEPRDVADALMFALGAPPHVQIHELVINPVGQVTTIELNFSN